MIGPNSPRERLREAIIEADHEWVNVENNKEFADIFLDKICALHPTFAGVLDGAHVIVPKEPTQAMIRAAMNDLVTDAVNSLITLASIHSFVMPEKFCEPNNTPILRWYRAMTQAAQEQNS